MCRIHNQRGKNIGYNFRVHQNHYMYMYTNNTNIRPSNIVHACVLHVSWLCSYTDDWQIHAREWQPTSLFSQTVNNTPSNQLPFVDHIKRSITISHTQPNVPFTPTYNRTQYTYYSSLNQTRYNEALVVSSIRP